MPFIVSMFSNHVHVAALDVKSYYALGGCMSPTVELRAKTLVARMRNPIAVPLTWFCTPLDEI